MHEVIALKETLSKIETLAEAALYLSANEEERSLQTELLRAIERLAYYASLPGQDIQPYQG
ncbi:hypothetical protein [Pantoea vagans]|uniref:hypothetical protein n=1 Tax=Pantoea vagans TaxID=470934 RepID=UPI003B026949